MEYHNVNNEKTVQVTGSILNLFPQMAKLRNSRKRVKRVREIHTAAGLDGIQLTPCSLLSDAALTSFMQEEVLTLEDEWGLAAHGVRDFIAVEGLFSIPIYLACMGLPRRAARAAQLLRQTYPQAIAIDFHNFSVIEPSNTNGWFSTQDEYLEEAELDTTLFVPDTFHLREMELRGWFVGSAQDFLHRLIETSPRERPFACTHLQFRDMKRLQAFLLSDNTYEESLLKRVVPYLEKPLVVIELSPLMLGFQDPTKLLKELARKARSIVSSSADKSAQEAE